MADKKRVLIVEDDLVLNLLYENYFEQLGFETEGELVYGKTAIEMTRELKPDLIVMDIILEGELNGIDAMKKIREFSDVPVIYITGNSDPMHVKRAKETDYLEYLTKPVEFEDLKNVLKKNQIFESD